jgi:hypothetical protein
MKKIALFILLAWTTFLFAGEITRIEYFIDTDPGFGSGTDPGIFPDATLDQEINIPLSGISPGFHFLGIRAKNDSGRWSQTSVRTFFSYQGNGQTLIEYFFDSDPGLGNGYHISTSGMNDLDENVTIPLSGISGGFHLLGIRIKNNDGFWSQTTIQPFFQVAPNSEKVTAYEYYFDTDPGTGGGTVTNVTAAASIDLNTALDLSNISFGLHQLFLRVKDDRSNWSMSSSALLVKERLTATSVVAAEYYIDTDLGLGNCTALTINPGAASEFSLVIPLNQVTDGFHSVGIRTKDSSGNWSLTTVRSFVKMTIPVERNITACEYFLDNDPGRGKATAVEITGGSATEKSLAIDLTGLSVGFHCVGMRFKDNQDHWSLTTVRSFLKIALPPEREIIAGEYFIDSDLGLGKATAIPITAGDSVNKSLTVDVTALGVGLHTIGIRTKSGDGTWSLTNTRQFIKEKKITGDKIAAFRYYITGEGVTPTVETFSDFTPVGDVDTHFSADLSILELNKNYEFHLDAVTDKGLASHKFSQDFKVVLDTLPPAAPQNVAVAVQQGSVLISWSPVTSGDLGQYNIYRGTMPNPASLLHAVNSPTEIDTFYIDATVAAGQTYYYRVTAQDFDYNESSSSPDVSVTPYWGPLWYVATTGSDATGIGSMNLPLASVQKAINLAYTDDEIYVRPGNYVGNVNFYGKRLKVISEQGADETTLTGSGGSVVQFISGESAATVLDGFKITGGSASSGGGIYCANASSPSLKNLRIMGNTGTSGGGVYLRDASNPVLTYVIIEGNTSSTGGGLYVVNAHPHLYRVTISGHPTTLPGAAIYLNNSQISLYNSVIANNSSSSQGVIYCIAARIDTILNSIVWGNSPKQIAFASTGSASSIGLIAYCDLQGGTSGVTTNSNGTVNWGTGNLDADPLFVDAASRNYHLTALSPCIDAGDPATEYDPDGTRSDIGVYFFDRRLIIDITLANPGEKQGDVTFNYTVSGYNQNVGLRCEYRTTATAAWHLASVTGDTAQITVANYSGSIVWKSKADIPSSDLMTAGFKITPYAYTAIEARADSVTLHLDNYQNQVVQLSFVNVLSEYTGNVGLNYQFTDPTGDSLRLDLYYQKNGDVWKSAKLVENLTKIVPANYSGVIHWNSREDLAGQDLTQVRLAAVCSDEWAAGISDTTQYFHVDNNEPPTANLVNISGEQGGDITINYNLSDPESDNLKINLYYSTDTDYSVWKKASVSGDTLISAAHYSGSLIWRSGLDLLGKDQSVKLKLVPADNDAGQPGLTGEFRVDNNEPPTITIAAISGKQRGDVPITFTLDDAEGDSVGIQCQYKMVDQGAWTAASVSTDTTDLSPGQHQLIWKSSNDISNYVGNVKFKITPHDSDYGAADSILFVLDQIGAPSVLTLMLDDLTEYSEDVRVHYTLADDEFDLITLIVYYSLDSGLHWNQATVSGAVTNLDSSCYSGEFIWDSRTDANGVDSENAQLRVTPFDGTSGAEKLTPVFHLDNNRIPQVQMNLAYQECSDLIAIPFLISDTEGDSVHLSVLYSQDNMTNWSVCSGIGSQVFGPGGYSSSVIWASRNDLPGMDLDSVYIKMTSADQDPGVADTIVLHIDNNEPPSVALDFPDGEQHGSVTFSFSYSDAENDPVSYEILYSRDGTNFQAPTGEVLSNDQSSGTVQFLWLTTSDLPNVDLSNIVMKIIVADADSGIPAIQENIHIDNDQGSVNLTELTGEQSADVTVPYDITETGSDLMSLRALFKLPAESQWKSATLAAPLIGIRPENYSGNLIWKSDIDLHNRDEEGIILKVIPADNWADGKADSISLHIDNERGPLVVSCDPANDLTTRNRWDKSIAVIFDKPLLAATVNVNNIQLKGTVSGNLEFTLSQDSAKCINLTPKGCYASLETLTVVLKTGLTDTDSIPLDGNANGDRDDPMIDNYSFSFRIALLGDYDLDNAVSLTDFYTLRDAWLSEPPDYHCELGPVRGDVPNFILEPDGKYNLKDLMSLISLWNWSLDHSTDIFGCVSLAKSIGNEQAPIRFVSNYEDQGKWNSTLLTGLQLKLRMNQKNPCIGTEVMIKYDPSILEFDKFSSFLQQAKDNQWVVLDNSHPDSGLISIVIFQMKDGGYLLNDFRDIGVFSFKSKINTKTEIQYFERLAVTIEDTVQFNTNLSDYTFETCPSVPTVFALHQNFPNPFNPLTQIRFEVPEVSTVRIAIFNIRGQLVKYVTDDQFQPGYYQLMWDGKNSSGELVSSGIYIYQMTAKSDQRTYRKSEKMMLLR